MRHATRDRVGAGWYTHRPTAVEAIQYTPMTAREVHRLLGEWGVAWWPGADDVLRVATPQGTKPVWYGDWIVRGTVGEVWPIKDEVFQRSYQQADGPPRI
jgi:hypothetical protein